MKHKKIILSLAALFFGLTAIQAQKGKAQFNLDYQLAIPTGSFRQNLDEISPRGFYGSLLFGVNNQLSLGIGAGFQDFYQKHPRRLYKLSDGSDMSAVLTHSFQTIPVMAKASYAFAPTAAVQPYAAVGVGANLISYSEMYGEFGAQEAKVGFVARPEAGVYIPFKRGGESGLRLGASYQIMPFRELGFENLNHLGIHAGISVPMRK